jgi:hypothetical protein
MLRTALLGGLLSSAAAAAEIDWLPEVTARLEGARFTPADDLFAWDTWIGAGAGLLRVDRATAYLTADVETVIGREKSPFDTNQANYYLETGARVGLRGDYALLPFFHHVSRHLVDRPKTSPVAWNILGVRGVGRLPAPLPVRFAASIGYVVEESLVGYDWELTAFLEADLLGRPWGGVFLRARTRLVTVGTESRRDFPRGSFADFAAQAGLRLVRGGRTLDIFVGYQHRNDALVLTPGARDWATFGLRIVFAPGGTAGPTLPVSWPGPH